MKGRLIVSSGEQKGRAYPLEREASVLGRDRECEIRLEAPGISRHHARFERRQEAFVLCDLGSRNGTFLNERPVKSAELRWGDRVRVGAVTLVFISEREGGETPPAAPPAVSATASLLPADIERPVGIRPGDAPPSADGRRLEALFGIARDLQSARGVRPALARLLQALFAATPAVRGAALLGQDAAEAREDPVLAARAGSEARLPEAPRQALARVFEEAAVLLLADDRLALAPLRAPGRVVGALVLEAGAQQVAFAREDLHFLAAVGDLAGGAVRDLDERDERARLAAARSEAVGQSPAWRRALAELGRAAAAASTVLIRGESGTGKELAARLIHAGSPRREGPLVSINCSAIPPGLAESELFGHERGAFTGAVDRRRGHFELADGGTIFLDEVGDLEPAAQAKLLRVLEERRCRRLGGAADHPLDVRVVAATNRDLAALVGQKAFREDLFFRLRVIEILLPPLRERPEDIPLLARHFLERFGAETGRRKRDFNPAALALLQAHPWPGNVRELRNAVERAVVLGTEELIAPADLGLAVLPGAAPPAAGPAGAGIPAPLAEVEREHIRRVLDYAGGNRTRAAEILGIDRKTLYAKLRQ